MRKKIDPEKGSTLLSEQLQEEWETLSDQMKISLLRRIAFYGECKKNDSMFTVRTGIWVTTVRRNAGTRTTRSLD